jgi:hypothetical protein
MAAQRLHARHLHKREAIAIMVYVPFFCCSLSFEQITNHKVWRAYPFLFYLTRAILLNDRQIKLSEPFSVKIT